MDSTATSGKEQKAIQLLVCVIAVRENNKKTLSLTTPLVITQESKRVGYGMQTSLLDSLGYHRYCIQCYLRGSLGVQVSRLLSTGLSLCMLYLQRKSLHRSKVRIQVVPRRPTHAVQGSCHQRSYGCRNRGVHRTGGAVMQFQNMKNREELGDSVIVSIRQEK